MKVLIAEDELLAAERIQALLKLCAPEAVVVEQVDSVEDTITFFKSGINIDLLLLDIQLADGKSFEIFDKINVDVPVIFITAFDQYAIQAFKFHSIDYLLKPIQQDDLQRAIDKYKRQAIPRMLEPLEISALRELLTKTTKTFKERFLIKSGNKLQYKPSTEVAYFFAEGKEAYLVTKKENRKYLIDQTLEELENVLDPGSFFRISRKFIISIDSVAEVRGLVSTRMEVKLNQPCEHEMSVSRDRAPLFKNWLDR
jgi:DNA-binding LytR/AlgR family response regulator